MNRQQRLSVEAIVAAVVLGILAAFALPRFQQAQLISQIDDRTHDLEGILNTLMNYELNHGSMPLDASFPSLLTRIAFAPILPSTNTNHWNRGQYHTSTGESWSGPIDQPPCSWLKAQEVSFYHARYGTNIAEPFRNSIVWAVETAAPFSPPVREQTYDSVGTFTTSSTITPPPQGTYPFHHPPFHLSPAIPFEASNGLTSPGKLMVWSMRKIPAP